MFAFTKWIIGVKPKTHFFQSLTSFLTQGLSIHIQYNLHLNKLKHTSEIPFFYILWTIDLVNRYSVTFLCPQCKLLLSQSTGSLSRANNYVTYTHLRGTYCHLCFIQADRGKIMGFEIAKLAHFPLFSPSCSVKAESKCFLAP